MKTWTKEAEIAINLCLEWGRELTSEFACEVYLFGSAIYKDGIQFDRVRSDLDIICVLPPTLKDADDRYGFVRELKDKKLDLELRMIPKLGRMVCHEPGVSVVPISELELKANIHKSGARRFFDKNAYLNLATGESQIGLRDAGVLSVPDELRQAIEYVQRIRNDYLSLAANGTGGIGPYRGHDPLPKALMRSAAQLAKNVQVGEWYDTRLGLELLHRVLSERRLRSEDMRKLFDDKLSVLRGGRGLEGTSLSDDDQLLLAEVLFEECAAIDLPHTVPWEINLVGGQSSDDLDSFRLRRIEHLAPGAYRSGGTNRTPQYRGSEDALTVLKELQRLEALAGLLRVDRAEVRSLEQIDSSADSVPSSTATFAPTVQLFDRIATWRPSDSKLSGRAVEIEFQSFLGQQLEEISRSLNGYGVQNNARLEGVARRFDFLLNWFGGPLVPIEVTRFQSLAKLTDDLLEFATVPVPMAYVLYGIPESIRKPAEKAASQLAQINSNVRTFLVTQEEVS
jgi:predicted nucleotidyltransferase